MHPDLIQPVPAPAIEDYAAIGNCRTLALVSRFGSIDWWCYPDFSGPSVFAALLDAEGGGRFALTPLDIESVEQRYESLTNVLLTRFHCRNGVLEVLDFMAMPPSAGPACAAPQAQEIVRIASCTSGTVELQALVQPRPGYASELPSFSCDGAGRWHSSAPGLELELSSSIRFTPIEAHTLSARVPMRSGARHFALLRAPVQPHDAAASPESAAQEALAATLAWWRGWCAHCTYQGAHADAVIRSALTLKLLTHAPTGAVVAAATTSLPESETGARNWDYRYCWLRDTSLVLQAFNGLGYDAESDAFLRWLLHATAGTHDRLQVVYDVHGGHRLPERTVPQLRGYHGIGPVRIGNAACDQTQHDVYGEVITTACDHVRSGGRLNEHEKRLVAGFVRVVCEIWREPDHGIWEIRLPPRHNTHSKLMCWAALDRALKLHREHGVPIDAPRVAAEREAIRADIEAHGFSRALGSYVGYYGSQAADAALLLIPRLGYVDANDPRMRGTVAHVLEQLRVDGLLYRYPPGGRYDGVAGPEHLFAIASFWCVACLAQQGRVDEAQAMYERLLHLRNHAGLYAEEFAAGSNRPMGNFPQAFSHVGAITAALALDAAQARSPSR